MAELFVINLDADLDGQYLSDLPVVNATPVARQIGFYLGSALTSTSVASELATYLATAHISLTTAGAGQDIGDWYVESGAGAITTSVGTTIVSAAEAAASTLLLSEAIGRLISAFVVEYANGDHANAITLANLEAEIDAVFTTIALDDTSGGGGAVDSVAGAPASDLDQDGDLQGIFRILMGAEPSGAGTFAEGSIIGNHRLIGGTRRIYSRDRIDACIHEGSLSYFKSATAFDGSAKPAGKGVQCLILNESGAKQ